MLAMQSLPLVQSGPVVPLVALGSIQVKAPCFEANDGDACGCRLPLGVSLWVSSSCLRTGLKP